MPPAVAAAWSGSYMRNTRGAPLPATGPSCLAGCALPLDEVYRVSRERLE